MFLVFISTAGHTRIDLARNPTAHVRRVASFNPQRVKLVRFMPGNWRLERKLRHLLQERHVRGNWYLGEVDEAEADQLLETARQELLLTESELEALEERRDGLVAATHNQRVTDLPEVFGELRAVEHRIARAKLMS